MTDQLLVKEKLTKWFWYWGVMPLSSLYIICLFFTLPMWHYIADDTRWNKTLTLIEARVDYFYRLLDFLFMGIICFMIVWSVFNAIKVFILSSKITVPDKSRLYMRVSVILFPIVSFILFIPISMLFIDYWIGSLLSYKFHLLITYLLTY
jgi:hypothetical protein